MMPPKPKPSKKDFKKDKRYKGKSLFKALLDPEAAPKRINTPEEAIAARGLNRQKILDEKKARIEDPRNKNPRWNKGNAS